MIRSFFGLVCLVLLSTGWMNAQTLVSNKECKVLDATSKAANVGKSCLLRGLVTSPNQRLTPTKGLTFTFIDSTESVTIFKASDTVGYFVQIGDSIEIDGKVEFFNGLTEVGPVSITLINSGNKLPAPIIISKFAEKYESSIVTINKVYCMDTTKWIPASSGFNVPFTNGTDTYDVRIDNDVDLFNLPIPKDTYNITGIQSQFDNKANYTEGYQLLPRFKADFFTVSKTTPPSSICTLNDAKKIDVNGRLVNGGRKCTYKGLVHSENFNASNKGLTFSLIDGTNAITVFHNKKDFGYTPKRGDSVFISGTDSMFNGLAEIFVDTVMLLNSSNKLQTVKPINVKSQFGESWESYIVSVDSLIYVDSFQWTKGSGSGFNVKMVKKGNTSDTFDIRIDNDVDLHKMFAPMGTMFKVTGVLSQFDNKTPFLQGYQLLPRDKNDFFAYTNDPYISFVSNKYSITEKDDSVKVSVRILNPNGNISAFNTRINLSKTTANGTSDYTYTGKTYRFPASSSTNIDFYIKIKEDLLVEGTEVISLSLINLTNNAKLGTDSTTEITILDNDKASTIIPVYKINQINKVNANGVSDSVGKHVFIKGIVHSDNFRPAGLEFNIQDNTGGISIFNTKTVAGYGVTRGDSLLIGGKVAQFNGLTQIEVDSVKFINSGNNLVSPVVITAMSESNESHLVQFKGASMVDINQWKPAGSGFNIDVTNGTDKLVVRIDADINLFKRTAGLSGKFNVTGIVGQFDNSSPFLQGYQLLPRDSSDIQFITYVSSSNFASLADIIVYPNPAKSQVSISSNEVINSIQIMDVTGKLVNEMLVRSEYVQNINTESYQNGVYLMRIATPTGTAIRRLVISK